MFRLLWYPLLSPIAATMAVEPKYLAHVADLPRRTPSPLQRTVRTATRQAENGIVGIELTRTEWTILKLGLQGPRASRTVSAEGATTSDAASTSAHQQSSGNARQTRGQ